MNTFETGMTQLLVSQLSELFFCESKLVGALEKMANAASDPSLKELFTAHRHETAGHVQRLEAAFAELHQTPKAFPCRGMEGLLEDGTWLMHKMKGDPLLDTALVAAAQKVELLEIASYRSLIRLCNQLGHTKVAQLCESNLEEETGADEKLNDFAEARNVQEATNN